MLYHSSRFIRAIVASFIVSTRSSLYRRLVHLEPAKLALPVGCIPIACYSLDQAFLPDTKQKDMRQVVVESLVANRAEWFGLRTGDDYLDRNVPLVIRGDGRDLVAQVGKRVDECPPDDLADGADLAVAANDPLLAPYFEGDVVEVGVISAELHHALHVVRPVGIKEHGDHFDRTGDACHAHVHLSASFISASEPKASRVISYAGLQRR